MSSIFKVRINWSEDFYGIPTAEVIEDNNGRSYEIGTVSLNTLANAIVGFTYYHHMTVAFESTVGESALEDELKRMELFQNKMKRIQKRIRTIRRNHPEIHENKLNLDNPENPMFIDLSIPITFPIPLPETDETHKEEILDRVRQLALLLGTLQDLELLKD